MSEGVDKIKSLLIGDVEHIWLEYDKQTDILYINFGYDIEDADESILTESNVVVRIKNNRVVSLTIFDFSKKVGIDL